MANPNIVNVSTILGNTYSVVATTADTMIVNNPASSGKIFKINTVLCTNIDGSNSADISIKIFPQDDLGGTANAIASTITVPSDSTLIVIDKSTSFYLLEDRSLSAIANSNSDIAVTVSWEEIS